MAALATKEAFRHIEPEEITSSNPVLKVIFESGNELNTVNKMVIERDVRKACEEYKSARECLMELYHHYTKVPNFVAHISLAPDFLAVYLKDENGLPQPVRQFLIIENKG